MNKKNVIVPIVLIVATSVTLMTVVPIMDRGNQVPQVPTAIADVPFTVELPFLYSQKLDLAINEYNKKLTDNVQKEQVTQEKVESSEEAKKPVVEVASMSKTATETIEEVDYEDGDFYPNVPLSADLQKRITKFADELNIAPTLVYAVMLQEHNGTKPNFTAVSATNDYGMMQINGGNFKWMKRDLKKKFDIDFNWKDPYHSAVAATYYLSTCYDAWKNKGYSEEDLFYLTILSYNMGVPRAAKYVKSNDPHSWKYVQKVERYKERIENGETIVKGFEGTKV